MPTRPKTPCNKPGCPALTDGRYCHAHEYIDIERAKARQKRSDKNRPGARKRGYDSRWDKARIHWLRKHPLCVYCQKDGRTVAAKVIDHIVPHRMDMKLFWDSENNWQSLCVSHHNAKSAKEGGNFG